MIEPDAKSLDLQLSFRVHHELTLDVSLRMGPEIGVIFGPSGAGKTTLLRLIAGLLVPDQGRVQLGGIALLDTCRGVNLPLRHRRIGMIFQDDLLFPHLNVADNISFGLKGWPRDRASGRQAEIAALCGVQRLLGRRPDNLSGGERQRVGLARALAPNPRLLLCDEPVSALDLTNRDELIARIRDIQRALAIPILYVTHSPAEAIALGSRVFVLQEGKIIDDRPPLDILCQSRKPDDRTFRVDEIRNVFRARVLRHSPELKSTRLALEGGPELIAAFHDHDVNSPLLVEVRADEIMLSLRPLEGVSARNQIPGTIERIVAHGSDAEVVVRTGGVTWIVSLVAPAVDQLQLAPGRDVQLIVKARSFHILN